MATSKLTIPEEQFEKPRDNGNFYARFCAQARNKTGPVHFLHKESQRTNTPLPPQANRSASSFIIHPIFNHS